MYSIKIVSHAVTSSTIRVSIKRHGPIHSPLKRNAQKVTCIIFFFEVLMFDGNRCLGSCRYALKPVAVDVFVVVVVVVSLSSLLPL